MEKKKSNNLVIIIICLVAGILFIINFNSILGFVHKILGLFTSLFIGIAIAFILNNPCMFIESMISKKTNIQKKSVKRGISITITYILLILVITLLIRFVIPQLFNSVQGLVNNLGTYFNNLQDIVNNITSFIGADPVDLSDLSTFISSYVDKIINSVSQLITQIITITANVISVIVNVFIAMIFSIYFLASKERILRNCKLILSTYLSKKIYDKIAYVYHIVVDTFNNYIIGQVTEAFILGILCFIGMIIFRFDYPLLISVIIGVLALIPIVGAYIGGVISFFLLLLISPIKAIWFVVFLVVLQQFEGNVIYPRVVGKSVGLPSMWVLLSIIVGGGLGGPLGILLGVPVASVFYTLIKNDVIKRNETLGKSRKG